MGDEVKYLKLLLKKCHQLLYNENINAINVNWLNNFYAEFLVFSNKFHALIAQKFEICAKNGNEYIEIIFVCLSQIVTCIKNVERTICGNTTSVFTKYLTTRKYFIDRLRCCLECLNSAFSKLTHNKKVDEQARPLKNRTFIDLMELILDNLAPFITYTDHVPQKIEHIQEANAEVHFMSQETSAIVKLLMEHILAFANVALKHDKKVLSTLCLNLLRECSNFESACELRQKNFNGNAYKRKLIATSIESTLYKLEDYINAALLRLIFTCYLDFDKLSIQNIRCAMQTANHNETAVDELIADFDVNMDRTIQIGNFAMAFAPNIKIKTKIRSVLASFESLDNCLIASLQTSVAQNHADVLEQHYYEEIVCFKNTMQEIIDSNAFVGCYIQILTAYINDAAKDFQIAPLQDAIKMGTFLRAHFENFTNQKMLFAEAYPQRKKYFKQFLMMLNECHAILMRHYQVNEQRITKRFKIMRTVLGKFHKSIIEIKPLHNVDGVLTQKNHATKDNHGDHYHDVDRLGQQIAETTTSFFSRVDLITSI